MRTLTKTLVISASLILLAGMALAGMALAADIRVLSVEEAQDPVRALGSEFKKETGQEVDLTISSAAALMAKLKAGETFDALIASEAAMDELDGEGLVKSGKPAASRQHRV